MADNAPPSRNPANSDGQMSGAFREILSKFLKSEIDDLLPAKIVAYDRDTNRATVQPMIAMVTTLNQPIRRNQNASVPVLNIGGGGFILSFNLQPGDLGWIKAADRDISNFLKAFGEDVPNTGRCHDFDNGLFIPDVMTGYTINPEDEEAVVLQSLDGLVRISLTDTKIKITAPEVEIDSAETTITGNLTVTGTVDILGITTTAAIIATAVNINGIPFSTHVHTGVTTGAGNTGGPV